MAKYGGFDLITDLLLYGTLATGAYVAYLKREDILKFIDSIMKPGGGGSGCGSKTCPTGQKLNSACNCVPNAVCNGKTCTAPQVLNTTTCNCETPGGGGGGGTGTATSFCAAGDWGSGRNNNYLATIAEMKKLNPKTILVPGDMSYSGGVPAFKKVTDKMRADIPGVKILGAQGNHDDGSYSVCFDKYSNSVTNIGNCSFMSLNSNSTGSAISYLQANASKMTQKWKIVFFHHPVYTVKSDHAATMGGIQSALAAAHVQLCIAAHNHTYQRFAPIGGVTHVVSGLGGESPYPVGSYSGNPANIIKYNSKFGTFYGNATNTVMNCKFVAVGGGTIDSFNLT